MRVYRIEDEAGLGPFAYNHLTRQLSTALGKPHYHDQFPTPNEEGLNFTRCHKCGCANPRQLVKWFPRLARQYLAKRGFYLTILEVPDHLVEVGQTQVIYVAQ